jgi:type IV secretory pathway TrbD component
MSMADFIMILLATALAAIVVLPFTDWALAKVGVKTA